MTLRRPATAFPLSTGFKRPRKRDEKHLAFVRKLPCCACMIAGVEAAHIRYGDLRYGKRETGIAEKPSDCWVLPLCPNHHRAQHAFGDEAEWWRRIGIDPLRLAALVYLHSGDEEAASLVMQRSKDYGNGQGS